MEVGGFHTNLHSKIPITIGTVPFAGQTIPNAPPSETVTVNMPPEGTNGVPNAQIGWVDNGNKNALYPTGKCFFSVVI